MAIIQFRKYKQSNLEALSFDDDLYDLTYDFQADIQEVLCMDVELSQNPEADVAQFNVNYAKVQGYINRISTILINVYNEKAKWQRKKSVLAIMYERDKNLILTNNLEIQKLRNKDLQNAQVDVQLGDNVGVLAYVNSIVKDLEDLISIITIKKDALDKANTNLSRQQRIVESLANI